MTMIAEQSKRLSPASFQQRVAPEIASSLMVCCDAETLATRPASVRITARMEMMFFDMMFSVSGLDPWVKVMYSCTANTAESRKTHGHR